MIAITGIEFPKACTSTQVTLGDIEIVNCPLYNVCKYRDTIRTNYKPQHCPLVEIVTCGDCKYKSFLASDCKGNTIYMCDKQFKNITNDDFFCSDGKRRE